jgi:hypothetical protein
MAFGIGDANAAGGTNEAFPSVVVKLPGQGATFGNLMQAGGGFLRCIPDGGRVRHAPIPQAT